MRRVSLLLLVVLIIGWVNWPQPLKGQVRRVAVLPFTIFSDEDLSSLREPLMNMVSNSLRQEGFQPVVWEEREGRPTLSDAQARRVASELASTFALYGSLSKIGEQISLDVRLVDVENKRPTLPIYVAKTGLENLAGAVADLAREVAIRILQKKKINQIRVAGNRRIEDEAIKLVVKTKSGDLYEPAKLREDLTAVYKMGYFQDVRIEADETPQGEIVTFVVTEKPTVERVEISGTSAIDEKDIRTALATKQYSILQDATLAQDEEKIKALYRDKGYYDAEVTRSLEPSKENTVVVKFQIVEHNKLYIKKIAFSGNQAFSDKELKDVMQTSEKGFFFWLTESGILKSEQVEVDVDRLTAFYHTRGYMEAKVGSPKITHDAKGIYLDFPVSEGLRYRVGKVDLTGDDPSPDEQLVTSLRLRKEEYFNREALAKDLEAITNHYTGKGYAFAEVTPKIDKNPEQQVVNVAYEVRRGEVVDFGRITISGNTKTRDKVIRRELEVVETARYDKAKLQRSVQNLRRLEYFESVDMDTSKGETPKEMNVDVKVKEKSTSFASIGAGYSSADKAFLMGQIAERNLGGRGQRLSFQGQLGQQSSRFGVTFTEPWLFDTPLAMSIELYNWQRDYTDYWKESWGGTFGLSYPVWASTRLYGSYTYDHAKVYNVADDAATVIKDQEGVIRTSMVSTTLRRDTKDHPFLTTRGSDNSVSLDYAGGVLGGDAAYYKTIVNSSWYFPLVWKLVGFLHGKAGYVDELPGGILPIYERFFLGGINSLRGYTTGKVGPRDPETGDYIGGNKMALFNAELLFPIVEEQGIRGVVFFDAGNAFNNGDPIKITDFRTDVGAGLRWYSPLGPMRLEVGFPLNPQDNNDQYKAKWQFSMGIFF
ncbi:MAG TPA: outer membrane protein assembly factor BamA [Syntrophobacteria bacterium]|nr:outer membrane protein assembly factor BamA [Syntrophobacteria bacterium]